MKKGDYLRHLFWRYDENNNFYYVVWDYDTKEIFREYQDGKITDASNMEKCEVYALL